MKDASGRQVAGAGRLLAFMGCVAAVGIASILYGLADTRVGAPSVVVGVLCLLSVGAMALGIAVTQRRRRDVQPPDDAAVEPTGTLGTSGPPWQPRWQVPLPLLVAAVVLWAVFLILTIAKERWLGAAANGLLLAASAYSLVQTLRRRPTS